MARLFFALWPDEQVRLRIARHALELGSAAGGREVKPEALHITLSFLGEIEKSRIASLEACAGQIFSRPFNFALNRAACFERAQAAWLGCTSPPPDMFALHKLLQAELRGAGFKVDSRPFMPHVTVVRGIQQVVPIRDIEPILWAAREFCLVESKTEPTGAVYTVLKTWTL